MIRKKVESNILMNEWHKGEQIRFIAKDIVQHINDKQEEEAVQNLVDFASLIYNRDMSDYATIEEAQDIKSETKSIEISLNGKIDKVESNLNAKIDKVESNLNARIDKVESNLNARIDKVESNLNARIDKVEAKIDKVESNLKTLIAESQVNLIKWIGGLILAQFSGMVYLFLKLSGKF
ncbi:MAG: hypothetical protein ACK4OM_04180 [Alphaproteobacteria bacterium]